MQRIKRKALSLHPVLPPRPRQAVPDDISATTLNKAVPVVVIGITRHQAVKSQQIFAEFNAASPESRPYVLAAVLDMVDSPRDYQFSAHNLGVVLHTLHPRPQVLVTGTAIPDAFLAIIEPVWRAYVKEVVESEAAVAAVETGGPSMSRTRSHVREETMDVGRSLDGTDGKTCWVQMSRTHPGTGPPAPGAFEEALRQLDLVFRS